MNTIIHYLPFLNFISLFKVAGIIQNIDSRIITKIHQLVGEGVKNVKEMKKHIAIFVKNDLFRGKQQPLKTNRRFNPSKNTIRNHMYKASVKLRFSKIDQANLEFKVNEWKEKNSADSFFFRGYGKVFEPTDEKILSDLVDDFSDSNEEIKVRLS